MAAEGGVLQPMSEKTMHEEIGNIRFDHIQKVKEDETSPGHSYDTSMKMGDSKTVPLQSLEILGDGHSEASAAATQDIDIISDKATDENLHQVTTEIVGNTEGQILNEAPSGIQDSLQENCKDADAGFQLESQNRAEKMPEDANMKPITSDEVTKEDELKEAGHMNLIASDVPEHVLADKGPENGSICEVSAKSSQDMNVVKDESEGIEDNEGMTEHEIAEKKTSETEIPEMLTSEIKGVKLTEDSQAEPEDASPDLKDVMKDVGEELLTKNEESIGKVDLAKQDVNKAADLEEEPKIHESTPAAIEEIVGKEDKPKESSNAALEEEGSETQDTTEEQDKPIEGDTSVQESATELPHSQLPIEKSPVPSTTETEDSTEEQYQAKEEGDASAQVPASEPPHFQSSNEKSLADISRSTTEDQFTEGDARKIMLLSEERAGEEEKLEEFCYEASAEPGTETQDATEGHNKTTEVADASPQQPAGELLHLELPIEKFTAPSTTDDQHDIDDGGELAPGVEEQVTEEQKLKESSNAESGEPDTETQDSTEEQDKETEEGDASAHMTTGELPHFQMSIKNPLASMGISTLSTEAQLTEDDVKELKLTEDSQAEPEDASPDLTDGMKDVGEETLAENEESIDKVDLVKQDVNKEADLEEEAKNHKLTPSSIEEMVGEEDMPKESSNAALEGPGSKTQDATEEKVKETEGDKSAQKFVTELTHLQLPIEKSLMPSTTEPEDSTEEQPYQATAEGDASSQMLASELPHLQSSIENPLVHISTSTIEDHFKEDDESKIIPSLSEERVGEEDKKRKESSNKESAKLGTEIQDATEEQDKTTEVENASIQMSEGELHHLQLAIEKTPVPSTTDDQLGIDDARELVPAFPEDQVREEKLKESCNEESGEPGTEIQDSTEKQDTETEEGDASAQMSAGDLLHLQQSIENPPVGISTSTTEAQLVGDDVEELVPALTEDRMGEDEKLTESSNVASEEPATETPDLVEVQEIVTVEGDTSAQMSASEQLHFQFQRENSAWQSTTEDQLEINDAKELAPCFIEELVTEEEKLKESSTAKSGETGTETQDSPEEKDEKTEEGDSTAHMSAGELPHLQLSIENQPEGISSSTTEAQLTGDDARELLTAFTDDRVGDDKKLKESSTIASEKPHNETQNSVKEQEKATDEGNALAQKSVTEDQLVIDDARETPGVIKEQVREEEKLKESCNVASGEPGTETQESTQEQDKETDERDASTHISAGELHHLQTLIENPSVGISTSTTGDKLMGDDARESVPASTENRVEEEEKHTESSNVASEEPATEKQDPVKEKEKATEQNDVSAQISDSGQLLLQLQIEKSPKPSASEGQLDTDDARELATCFTEEQVKEEKLKESCNAASGEPGTETQESTQEQDKETDERDASTHISAGELHHLQTLIENPSVGISTSTTGDKLMGDDARESVPASTENRVEEEEKLTESSNVASEEPATEKQDSVKEQEKATEQNDVSAQMSDSGQLLLQLQIEKSPKQSASEGQLETDDARDLAPQFTEEQVKEEEELKESCNAASGEPGTETQESTQEQDKETDERDASAHISAGELPHLKSLIENPSVGISTSTTEAKFMGDDARESVRALTEDRVKEEEKLTESSNVASEEPDTKKQDSVKEQEKATEQTDVSAQMSNSGQRLLQLQIEESPKPSASEGHLETNEAREVAPHFTEEQVREEEKLKESCNAESGEPGNETQESTEEQEKQTDEKDASAHISSDELPHLQSLIENPSVGINTSTTEAKFMGDDARESVPALAEDRVKEEEKLTESSNVASEEPDTKKQDSVKEQEKATEQTDVSAQMSNSGQRLLQLQIEKSPKPSASEGHLETNEAREVAPHFTEEQIREEEKLKESCNAESGEPGNETQESTEEQEKQTDEKDASAHISSDELPHLQSLIENPSVGISTSTTEAKFMGDDARESVPALAEDRVEEEKLTESSNVASEEPATKKQDSMEEQEKATEQSDVSARMSDSEQLLLQLQIEKSPKPSASQGQLETDGARDLAPLFTEEQVREEEKELKESPNIESGGPGTETQDSTQEQDKETEEGDASAHMSADELPHLQLSIENPPESISTPITEAQITEDDLREAVPALNEDTVGEEEKLTESPNVASEEPATETQGSMEEQEKATEEGDAFAQKSDSELPHMQLSTEKSPKNTTECQFETDDTKELLPALIEERVREEEKIIESSTAVSGEPCTETQGSREEQEEATEEGYTSAQQPSSDLHHLQLSTITSPKYSSTSTIEDKLETDDGRDHVPLVNPREEGCLLPSIGTMTQETIPDQEITQQTDETNNESMNNKQDEVLEDKQAAPVAGIEAPSYVKAIENVDDLQKEFIEKETVQAASEEIINEEVLDLHPKKDETVADKLKNLSASEEIEVTGAEMKSTGNKQLVMNVEENTQEKETTYENIEDVVPESMSGCQETINATDEKQDASKAVSDEQKQQTTESADNLVEVKQNKIDIEKDDTISASIPDNQRQHATGELEGKIITDDDKVNQMIPPLISPKADAAMVKPEDDSNNKISSNIDTHVKDTEIIHDAADEKKEKVPSSICEEQAHEFTNINENIETGFQQEMAATENIGTISESIPEEQNKDTISYASNIITESMTEVDTVDNKISGKVDQDENAENAEINFETNFSKNLADTSDIDILILETKIDNVGGNNEEPSHKECKENHNTTSTNLTREAHVPVKKEEDTEKHEIMSELMPEKQDQVTIDESKPLEVEKRIYDVKVGPISSPESLTESSMQKDENTMLDVEETEKIQTMSEEISEKPEQQTSETETAEAEKRTYDEDEISDSLSSSKNVIEDNMHRDERPTSDVEEHSNESSKVDEILEKQLSEDDKTTNGAILGSSSEEKVESLVTEEEETRKSGICLNQSEVKTENISLDENKDDIIPKDDTTLGGTFDPSTVGEKLDTCIDVENEKLKIDDEEGNNVSNSVNIEPKIVYEGCKDNEEKTFEGAATESADRDQDNKINEENVGSTNADPHDKIKDSNIPTEGHDYERKPESEPENISSAEAESEPALEKEKIAIPPSGDNEDITVAAKEETEKKLDAYAYNLSHVMVDQADFRSQKGHQIESEKEQNDSTRDVISNQEVESYLKSKEQNLETIAEITKATEDDQSKELEYLTAKAGGSSSNGTDDSTATFTLVESSEQVVEKQKDMPSGLSDKTQVHESTERNISVELDLLKGNHDNVGELDKTSILDSEDQSDKHITEIGVIKSDIAEGTLPAAEDSTKEKTIDTYTLPEDNNKSHQVKEAEVAPLEEAVFETSVQPQGIVDDKIDEDNGLEHEEDVESEEDPKNQENAIIKEEGYLSRDNDNQENAQASVFSETATEEDVDKVITKMIDNKDTTNKESPGSKIDDLSINYNLDEDNLKGEESNPHPKMDIMEPVILEESEEKCESIIKECQEVHDENESLEKVLLKDAKESNQQGEQLDNVSERGETATSIGGIEKETIEKDDLSVVHETACQKDEIVTERKETRTEPQDTLVVVDSEKEVKEVDIVSASSKSKEKPENDLAVSSSEEASATETVVQEPEFATEKTSGAEGSTESAVVSETFTVNSIDGDKTGTNILNDIPNIPEVAKASGEDTIDTEIKEKVAEKEEIAENESSSANETEDKYLQASSFTQETQEGLPGDANEVVEQIVEASHGVGESENSQNKENQQSNLDDLPVSRFLMDHILQQGDVSNEASNIKSENKIEENTSDKHMNVSITEQEIVMDPLSAEKVPNENIIGNKDLEKVEHTILEQGNVPDEASDVEAENKIKEENTSDKQKGISIQEQEVIMDSVSVLEIPKEKNISEDNNQKKLEDHILQEVSVPDEVCDEKAENIITEEMTNDKHEEISIKEQEVALDLLSTKKIPKEEDLDKVEVASNLLIEEKRHESGETKEYAENPVTKDAESPHSNICMPSSTTASEQIEIEVPSSLNGVPASIVTDDHKDSTPTEQSFLGSEGVAQECTSSNSVQDEKITAAPIEGEITENSTQKDNNSPVNNVCDASLSQDGENTKVFDNVEQTENVSHSISEEQITKATSELLGSTTSVIRSEEPQANTQCEQTEMETMKNTEEGQAEATEIQVQNMKSDSVEQPEESTLEKVQLSDLLLLSRTKTTQKTTPAVIKDSEEAKESTYTKVEEEKTDKEKGEKEDEEEHKTNDNAAVIVEARDAELKPAHKKSHNILSGVGSKVKHSIAKVKKAITGKSSHQKTISPK
ncbi:hypothetical protein J5N97_027659 [Dioscorea zingiberensis]|uniref:Uncharacterized protein n=1 Tax=Dioscorea zingiberensis TaxID=325984 RepID=A0A9D5H418_9LILI|nr:hypothetical protein J5N97_027659 [Dioscorea zingiberensis]